MRFLILGLLLIGQCAGQGRFEQFGRDLERIRGELRISELRAAVVESGRVVWKNGKLRALAPSEVVIAAGIRVPLDDPIAKYNPRTQVPPGATIRQILSHTADGTPGEEFLYNPEWFDALQPLVARRKVDAVKFAQGPTRSSDSLFVPMRSTRGETLPYGLGWFTQDYHGIRLAWSFSAACLVLKIPDRNLTLIVSADSKTLTDEPRLPDGNVLRSPIALAFLKDLGLPGDFDRDELENRALLALYFGQRADATAALRQALDRFPELETANDLTLLYLLSELGFRETESCATVVIQHHPYLPPAWYYYGLYVEHDKRYRESAACFHRILDHQPPWHHWTVAAAKKELAVLE